MAKDPQPPKKQRGSWKEARVGPAWQRQGFPFLRLPLSSSIRTLHSWWKDSFPFTASGKSFRSIFHSSSLHEDYNSHRPLESTLFLFPPPKLGQLFFHDTPKIKSHPTVWEPLLCIISGLKGFPSGEMAGLSSGASGYFPLVPGQHHCGGFGNFTGDPT